MNKIFRYLCTAIIAFTCCMTWADNGQPIVKSAFMPFRVGEIKPEGWLRDWAKRAATGMTKTMGEQFTEFVKGWADENQGGWWHYEQTAYYTDGFTRLGFILDDTTLINRSRQVMEAVIARQKPNGYIHSANKSYVDNWGTTSADYGLYWSEGVFCRAALAYYTATNDERVLTMLKRVYENFPLFAYNDKATHPFNGGDLDNMRRIVGVENMLEVARLSNDQKLADRALQVMKNYEGAYIENWVKKKEFLRTAICHGVSYNEASKLPAAAYIWNADPDYLAASVNSYEFLQENSVLPNGSNSSNEYLHGIGAFEATESCDITDFMWSNIWMARATGNRCYGDRIERDAFNALPGAVNSSFTQCLYTQAPNRIPGFHLRIRDDGNYYKEMHWPTCCPANINRALPNYIINMAMVNNNDELMWLTYGPAHLKTQDGRFDITCDTQYPFRDTITLRIQAIPQQQSVLLRVPEWCSNPQAYVNGKKINATITQKGFVMIKRNWKKGDNVQLILNMAPVLTEGRELFPYYKGEKAPSWGIMAGSNGSMVLDRFKPCGRYAYVSYGPLLCGLSMQNRPGDGFELNEELWHEFRYALTKNSLANTQISTSSIKQPFSWKLDNAPITITAKANIIDWNPDKSDPTMPIAEPPVLKKDVEIKLIPYGFMAYRIAMFPITGE